MDGKDIIRKFEGCKLKSYLCPAGKWTIGYGHTFGVKSGRVISQSEAEVLLDHDYQEALNGVESVVKVPLTENQLEALTSFVFNLGLENLKSSTLLKKLNAKDYVGAANEFDKWIFAAGVKLNGLIARRAAEKKLFLGEDNATS